MNVLLLLNLLLWVLVHTLASKLIWLKAMWMRNRYLIRSLVRAGTWPLESISCYLLLLLLLVTTIKHPTFINLNYASGFLEWPLLIGLLLGRRRIIPSEGLKQAIFSRFEKVISFGLIIQTVLENSLFPSQALNLI